MTQMKPKKEWSFGQTGSWFLKFTSIGGLAQFQATDIRLSKLIWLILFMVGTVLTILGIKVEVDGYFDYGVITKVMLVEQPVLKFPAVTICNQNRIKCNNLQKLTTRAFSEGAWKPDPVLLEKYCSLYILTGCDITMEIAKIQGEKYWNYTEVCNDYLDVWDNSLNISSKFGSVYPEADQKLLELFLSLSAEEKILITHRKEELIKSCTFGGHITKECEDLMSPDTTRSTVWFSPIYGGCYTYNFNEGVEVKMKKSCDMYLICLTFLDCEHWTIPRIVFDVIHRQYVLLKKWFYIQPGCTNFDS